MNDKLDPYFMPGKDVPGKIYLHQGYLFQDILATGEERTQVILGLRELADFIEANPDLPVPTGRCAAGDTFHSSPAIRVKCQAYDSEMELTRMGELIGDSAESDRNTISRKFSGNVSYNVSVYDIDLD